jgi:hypothetical protein
MLTQTNLQREIVLKTLDRKVAAGDVLGTLKLTDDFGNVKEIDLVAMADAATDNTREYVILSALSLGSLAVCAAAATFLRKRKSRA